MKTDETALEVTQPPRMATQGQLKDICSLMVQAVPADGLTFEVATSILGNKGAFSEKLAALFPDPAILADPVKVWQKFYLDVFGLTVDLSQVRIPVQQKGFIRLIFVAQGLTLNGVYDACAKRFSCWRYNDDLDAAVTENDRTPTEHYAIWVRDTIEADQKLQNLSANDLKEKQCVTMTLLERMLFELKFFLEAGKHLDIQNVSLCAGSRSSGGGVPGAYWGDGEFEVGWCRPDGCDPDLRARQAVTL